VEVGARLLDTIDRCGYRGLEEPSFELPAMGAVVDPVAGRRNPLADGDRGGMTDQGDQLAAASYPNPNDTKAALGVLVGDALDQSREHLAGRGFGLDLQEPRHSVKSIPSASTVRGEFLLILSA
jgi:hypothetical protein